MLKIRTAALGLVGLLGCPVLAVAEPITAPVPFVPHRAIYQLEIGRSSAGSGVTDVNGRIVYELTGSACEGFTQNMRFVTVTTSSEGSSQTTDLRTSSWEGVPAKTLRFSSSTYFNDQLSEQARGTAERKGLADVPSVDLAKPEKKTFDLGQQVYFPMQHSAAVIDAARAGKTHLAADLYDGSEKGAKVYATSAIIGQRVAPGANKSLADLKGGEALDQVPSWPVSMSYFSQGNTSHKDELPLYEMSYRFHENGVTSEIVLDYGEYAMKGKLKELVMLEPTSCAPTTP
jgi:EipB-like